MQSFDAPTPPEPGAGTPPPPSTPSPEGGVPDTTPRFNFGAIPVPAFAQAPTKDERMWGMLLHLGGALGGLAAYVHVPGGNLLIPFIIWLIKKEGSPFINDQGKEVLNFHLCVLVAYLLCIASCVGIILIYPIMLIALILGIVGAVKANEGVAYRYPVNFRLIK
jgi:uncharacterized Tic20 family protein